MAQSPSSSSQQPTSQQNSTTTEQQPASPSTGTKPAPPKLQLQDLPPEPHTLTPAEIQQQRQQQALNAAIRLAALQAHWGPEMTTPGLALAMTEMGRTKTAEGTTQITYQLKGSGFSPTDRLMLVRWPLDGPAKVVMGGIELDAKGIAVCNDTAGADALAAEAAKLNAAPAPNSGTAQGNAQPAYAPPPSCATTMKADQPVQIETTAAQGEAIRVALVTSDRKRAAETSAIPFPIENTDKGCKLSVVLSVKDAGLVLVDGEGFPPNMALKLDASTGTTMHELHAQSNAKGQITIPLLTGEQKRQSGTTTVKFAGINRQPTLDTPKEEATPAPDCAPAVSYAWGDGSYKAQ
ncbi:MAG: hypothetical protein ACLGXA_23305 [Acidobacteriota bacterium]